MSRPALWSRHEVNCELPDYKEGDPRVWAVCRRKDLASVLSLLSSVAAGNTNSMTPPLTRCPQWTVSVASDRADNPKRRWPSGLTRIDHPAITAVFARRPAWPAGGRSLAGWASRTPIRLRTRAP